jgi:mannose-6-phosphate isomerase-like protein (cupin superfamily)
MDVFTNVDLLPMEIREAEHSGSGPIGSRRLMDKEQFNSSFDFADFTIVPPGSSIGRHYHHGNEELYFVTGGEPRITVNGTVIRGKPGTLTIVRSGEWHELVNDTGADVTIFVVQAGSAGSP